MSLSFQIVSTALIRILLIEIFVADAMVIRGYTLILNNSTELSVQFIIVFTDSFIPNANIPAIKSKS